MFDPRIAGAGAPSSSDCCCVCAQSMSDKPNNDVAIYIFVNRDEVPV